MKQALELALDALTYIHTETSADEDELIDKAITAIKEALVKLEQNDKCREALDRLAEENKRLGLEY